LARQVRSRRIELGYATTRALAGALGISHRTIGNLERGEPVGANTLAAVENVLGWQPGSAEETLAGGEPVPRETTGRGTAVDAESSTRTRIVRASVDELMEMRALVREAMGEEAADVWLRAALQIREDHARGPAPAAEHRDAG
jgi:transcriptional regulator with XRE-family HTH domain